MKKNSKLGGKNSRSIIILNIYIGYDPREDLAYEVCKFSIEEKSNAKVFPLKLQELKDRGLVTRPNDPRASTEFTFTRFLVPYLNDFQGWALFVDCDFLFEVSPSELFEQADDRYAVMVAKHEYNVTDGVSKMDGCVQHAYPRKNWSSCILYNCAHPKNRMLVPEIINNKEMSYLHRFSWLDDTEIGEFSHEYNWLVGHYKEPDDGSPKIIHYTLGMPFMQGYENCEYSNEWYHARDRYSFHRNYQSSMSLLAPYLENQKAE